MIPAWRPELTLIRGLHSRLRCARLQGDEEVDEDEEDAADLAAREANMHPDNAAVSGAGLG